MLVMQVFWPKLSQQTVDHVLFFSIFGKKIGFKDENNVLRKTNQCLGGQ